MANIHPLYPGCTAQEILDTINALIAVITDGAGRTMSYSELENKPRINSVVIEGDIATQALNIKISEAVDYAAFENAWATKNYVDSISENTVNRALEETKKVLDSKLDKNLTNIEAVDTFSGEAFIPIVTGEGIKKTRLRNVAAFTETRSVAVKTTLSEAVKSQLKILALIGEQNGRNVNFSVEEGYNMGTSSLFFNGQLLTAGTDYDEASAYSIVMLTHIPANNDVLIFMAVPLSSKL